MVRHLGSGGVLHRRYPSTMGEGAERFPEDETCEVGVKAMSGGRGGDIAVCPTVPLTVFPKFGRRGSAGFSWCTSRRRPAFRVPTR